MGSITNLYVDEGTASVGKIITLPWRCRSLEIINDSAGTLGYKFNASESYATLKVGEVCNPPAHTKTIILNGNGSYRIRAYG